MAVGVVCSFVGGWGHAEPLLPVAELLTSMGWRCVFAGQTAVLPRLAELGFATIAVGPDTLGSGRSGLAEVDRERERRVMREHFVLRFGRRRAVELRGVLADQGAGLLVCDEVDVGALVAAEALGVPSVVVNVIAAGRLTSPSVIGAAWNELRSEHGLPPDPSGARLGGSLMLAPFPASFRDPSLPVLPQWRPVRPAALAADRWGPESAGPFVYATLGTVFNVESGDLLDRVVRGVGLAGVDGLVTVGPGIDVGEFSEVAPRVRVEQFIALAQVLARCDVVVCHGGSGTLMAALSAGVPVVVLPVGADQPDNADRCEALGCGLVLDPAAATPKDIAEAVEFARTDPRLRANAARLADEARSQPALTHVLQQAQQST